MQQQQIHPSESTEHGDVSRTIGDTGAQSRPGHSTPWKRWLTPPLSAETSSQDEVASTGASLSPTADLPTPQPHIESCRAPGPQSETPKESSRAGGAPGQPLPKIWGLSR